MSAPADLDLTRAHQRDASDPRASAWVVANAGSGKTHVLTQRVIRLLLAGTDPAAILCLTFTKVAAAEMSRRVFQTLGEWTLLDEAKLAQAIADVEGRAATGEEMRQARRLFAKALETPGGLKIQTIHAFCERLLHEFPFEANVPGQFAVMDDTAATAALASSRADIMARAAGDSEPRLREALRLLARNYNDDQINLALDALIGNRDAFRRWIQNAAMTESGGGVEDALADLRARLGLLPGETEESVCRDICASANWSREKCRELAANISGSSSRTGKGVLSALTAVIEAENPIAEASARIELFLTKDGSNGKKARSPTNRLGASVCSARPGLDADFSSEADRLLGLLGRLNAARAYEITEALLVVGDAILQAYHQAKRQAGALDFDDLIVKTRNLLSRSDAAQWVLYKLDRRVDHILVDEAQDTSPDQWSVVRAIAEDFFSGEGASRVPRTIFAVGDDKQSIFRFQGAAPAMLKEMREFFEERVKAAAQTFAERPLFLSFRSTHEILAAVDTVFDLSLSKEITESGYTAHASNRPHEPGHVILLPRTVRRSREEPEDWTVSWSAPSAAETELAERIADEIDRVRGTILPSGKPLSEGEILVLVRRRDAFAAAMNRALLRRQIPTAGADRIPVSTHIAILDLLALADVMLLPEDDLQLAALLKSPLLGLREEQLMQLATERGGGSLWGALRDRTEEPFTEIAARLGGWRRMADQVTPFRFFATVLGPDGGRQRFRARLGGEADDVLDTFLSQALNYETSEPPSLQGFVRFVRANERDIKRETEEGATGVRVMTVHGAKGLEADVVFLADTGGAAVVGQQRDVLVDIGKDREDPAFLWRRNVAEQPDIQRVADAREDAETEKEYLRLLYVAMTRARDVLYVAGVRLIREPPRSWYTIVRDALVPEGVDRNEDGELAIPFRWPETLRPPLAAKSAAVSSSDAGTEMPAWLHHPAPTSVLPPQPLRPSLGLGEPDPLPGAVPATRSAAPGEDSLRRGRLVHLLLQFLPALPPGDRARAAERLLAGEVGDDPAALAALLGEANAVLSHAALRGLFSTDSRAEVAIVGHVETERGTYAVSGRIDRLVRDLAGFRLFDFKTDRAVPASAARVDTGYILQMALYRKLLMEMEPGVPVEATLIYTAGPNVMPIPTEMMESALAGLGVRANPVP